MLHADAAIWKERRMITDRNSSIKREDLILALLEIVQLLTQVAVIHCRGNQRMDLFLCQGNRKADEIAKQIFRLQELEQIMGLGNAPPPTPAALDSLAFPNIKGSTHRLV